MKGKFLQFACGVLTGAALFGGASAVAAGIAAEPSWSPIYVDGQQVQMTAYNIGGNNYVKLRDIGKAVGFNVYFQDGVQVDSKAPYTGEAPAQAVPQKPTAASADNVRVNCYKDGPLSVGEPCVDKKDTGKKQRNKIKKCGKNRGNKGNKGKEKFYFSK